MGSWATLADLFDCCPSGDFQKQTGITLPSNWDGVVPAPSGGAHEAWWTSLNTAQQNSLLAAQDVLDAAQQWLHQKTCHKWPGITTRTIWLDPECRYDPIDLSLELGRVESIVQVVEYVEPVVSGTTGTVSVVDSDTYRLEDHAVLVRQATDSKPDPWPEQDGDLPLGYPGTWNVQLQLGEMPGKLHTLAVAQLGCDLLSVCLLTPSACDTLPEGVTSMNRNGVTLTVRSMLEALQAGGTNNEFTDMFLNAYGCDRGDYAGMRDPADVSPFIAVGDAE